MNRGILIAVEGIDGAGKTTQVQLLCDFLSEIGEPFVRSKEPTNGKWGQKIRQSAASGRMSLDDELHAFVEDRKEHLRDLIEPSLQAGKIVILDRYFYSTIAYQGSRGGNILAITQMMREFAPEPDAVIILDVPEELGVSRIRRRDHKENYFEDIANLRAVREVFLHLAKINQLTVIDGTASVEIVQRAVLTALLEGVFYKRRCAKPAGCDDRANCSYRKSETCPWAQMAKKASEFLGESRPISQS